MKRRMIVTLLPVVLLAGSMVLNAQPRSDRPARMIDELGLSEEQAAKMKDLRSVHMKSMADHQAEVKKAQIDLRGLMTADAPDKAVIKSKMEDLADLRLKQQQARVDHLFEIRSILTPEQQTTWKGMMRDGMRAREGRGIRRPCRDGMRGGMMHDGRGMPERERMHW